MAGSIDPHNVPPGADVLGIGLRLSDLFDENRGVCYIPPAYVHTCTLPPKKAGKPPFADDRAFMHVGAHAHTD
jgi:hypothetical protein